MQQQTYMQIAMSPGSWCFETSATGLNESATQRHTRHLSYDLAAARASNCFYVLQDFPLHSFSHKTSIPRVDDIHFN